MQITKIQNADQKICAYVYYLAEYNLPASATGQDLISNLLERINPNEQVGYAGLANAQYLKLTLKDRVNSSLTQLPKLQLDKSAILHLVQEVLLKCQKALPSSKPIHVYIFPSFDPFTQENLKGVGGFTPYDNVCHLYLCQDFKAQVLQATLAHEYNHTLIMSRWSSLLDSLIFEGLAEHFREHVLQGPKANYVTAVSKAECQKHFRALQSSLSQTDMHFAVFFDQESLQYPHWLGYSLGYHIVESFLKQNPNLPWSQIMQIKPEEIAKPFISEL